MRNLFITLVALGSPVLMADNFTGFTIDFVQIPGGNVADDNGYGAVGYDYRIAKYEVSRLMIESYNSSSGGPTLSLHDMTSFGSNGADRAESAFSPPNDSASKLRVYRGGYWNASSGGLASPERANNLTVFYSFTLGFRVASVSPSTASPEIAVSGNGFDINNAVNTPMQSDHTYFGPTVIGNPPLTREYVITNDGDLDLSLTGTPLVEVSGSSAFTVSVQPSSATVVAGGGTRSFTVAFDPTTSGIQIAVVSISNNDADENPFTFYIEGDAQTAIELFDDAVALAGLTGSDALPDAEPFDDGVSNLLKYAFNMDLAGPASNSMPSGGTGGLPGGRIVEVGGLPYWRVEFVRRKGSGLDYDPVKSSDLSQNSFVSFSAVGMAETIDLLWERVIYDEPIALPGDSKCFSRVEVTLP